MNNYGGFLVRQILFCKNGITNYQYRYLPSNGDDLCSSLNNILKIVLRLWPYSVTET